MNHAELPDEIYELYALGLLDASQSRELEEHLREGCNDCAARLHDANRVVLAMAGIAEQVQPPSALRKRIVASVAPPKPAVSWAWGASGLAAACLVLLGLLIWSSQANSKLRTQISTMRVERNELRTALEFMSRPDTRAVQFGRIESAPRGRVFVSRSGGVVFVGARLPALPSDKTFELWVVPASGAPQPAGVFRPSAAGDSVEVSTPDVNATGAAAVAVSVEPLQGSTAPTTKPFLIVPLS